MNRPDRTVDFAIVHARIEKERRVRIRQLAGALILKHGIPEGSDYAAHLTHARVRSNREAVECWVASQILDSRVPDGVHVLGCLDVLFRAKLESIFDDFIDFGPA